MGTIRLVNTNRSMPIPVKAFDGEEVMITNTGEAIPVDEKFGWNLPKGIKNLDYVRPQSVKPLDPIEDTPPEGESSTENTTLDENKLVSSLPDTPTDSAQVDETQRKVSETPVEKTGAVGNKASIKSSAYATGSGTKTSSSAPIGGDSTKS